MINVINNFKEYENNIPWSGGIVFRVKNKENLFISIKFGDGTNGDVLEDDCDDYIMFDLLQINQDLELESFDGGMFEFNQEKSKYEGSILNALEDVLDFAAVSSIENLEPILKLGE